MKKLFGKNNEKFINFSESLDFENYKAIRGESKSGGFNQSKINLKKSNLKRQGIERISYPRT